MFNFLNTQFIILSCDNYIDSRIRVIDETWGKIVNKVFLIDSDLENANCIGYNTPKNYDGIQEKYIQFFINYNFNEFQYYFFTDDDTFIVLNNLQKENIPKDEEVFCIGRHLHLSPEGMDKWGNNTHYPLNKISGENSSLPLDYVSGGSGFILSTKACKKIKEYLRNMDSPNIPRSAHGDVSIGFWMRACGIKVIPSNNFWWDVPEKLIENKWEKYEDDNTALTFHYVSTQRMPELNSKYNLDIK
jgi:hypothetical protein